MVLIKCTKYSKNVIIYLLCVGFTLMPNSCTRVDINKDAKEIVDSKFDPKTIEKILLYRTQKECIEINIAIGQLNGDKPLVDPKYTPKEDSNPYDDLLFALVNDSMTVFSMYLGDYLDRKDETFIIMIFIQINDRLNFLEVYNRLHDRSFDDIVGKQRRPFRGELRHWAEANRDPDKTGCIIDTCSIGQELENDKSSWNKKRDQLDYILMKESFKDSRDSIRCYGTLRACDTVPKSDFEKDISSSIKNHDLVDLYVSLIRYVQNEDTYLAQKLHDYCDGKDNWTMWIIILTTRRGDPMKSIDEAFKNQYKNVTLKDYIKTCDVKDPQLKDMLTVLVDPSSASKRQPPPPPPPPPLLSGSEPEMYLPVDFSPIPTPSGSAPLASDGHDPTKRPPPSMPEPAPTPP